jgi:hypothetical protein
LRIKLMYKSAVFCEHANETPINICTCPEDCACREFMCQTWYEGKLDEDYIKSVVKVWK